MSKKSTKPTIKEAKIVARSSASQGRPRKSPAKAPVQAKRPSTQVKGKQPSKAKSAPQKPKRARTPIAFAILTAFFVALLLYIANFTSFKDYLLSVTYRPTVAMEGLADSLQLTDSANLIFRASQPELHNDDFSEYCASTDPDRSILGCYNDRRIHIYNIETNELAGIVESTTAHELLHAIWERLPGHEKDELLVTLNQVYSEHYDDLKIITEYPSASQATELYARVGTQIADLPEELESHYAQYFQDRAAIVAFYESYAGTFAHLAATRDAIIKEIDTLSPQIDQLKTDYNVRASVLSQAIKDFNQCASTAGCFDSATFATKRRQLVADQSALSELYLELSTQITHYNELVDLYNSNLLKERKLVKIINPNYQGVTINE